MLSVTDYILIAFFGSIGAFLSGFLGVGGGIVYIPLLDYFLSKMGMQNGALVKGILANSLFAIIFSGGVSSYNQYKLGNFYPKQILQTAIPGIITAFVLTYFIKNGDWYSKQSFNYVFALMLFVVVFRMFGKTPKVKEAGDESAPWHYSLTGFFAGIITALSGLGGGVVMTPVFTDVLKQHIRKAASISNGVIPMFALTVGLYNLTGTPEIYVHQWQVGYVVMPIVLPLILATFIFAPIGVKTAHTTSKQVIRYTFAFFSSLIFLKVLYEIFTR